MIAIDCETSLIQPAQLAPTLVCVSFSELGLTELLHARDPATAMGVQDALSSGLVGHNVAFDLAVLANAYPHLLPKIWHAYDSDRIADTQIREQLIDIAAGRHNGAPDTQGVFKRRNYSLQDCAYRRLGIKLEKDEWRLRYADFLDTPLKAWPEGAKKYSLEDAESTYKVWQSQEQDAEVLQDQYNQARAAWALHLSSAWGFRTDPKRVADLYTQALAAYEVLGKELREIGLVRANGSRDTKAVQKLLAKAWRRPAEECKTIALQIAQREAPGVLEARVEELLSTDRKEFLRKDARLTPTGLFEASEDACQASGDATLIQYASYGVAKAVMSKDIPMLEAGVKFPIHTRYGIAASGRTTSSAPNIQNLRALPGLREVFVPREGNCFYQADFEGLELRTLAQVCLDLFGRSRLAEVINAGLDPHLDLAAKILKRPYAECDLKSEEVQIARKLAKVGNFGIPGGLGETRLIEFAAAKPYSLKLSVYEARKLKQDYFQAYPEVRELHAYTAKLADSGAPMKHVRSNRFRGGANYTAMCNSWFQGLGADAAKRATYLVSRACYSPGVLSGCRLVAMIHDEIILEGPNDEHVHARAHELERLMIAGAKEFLPDLRVSAPPIAMMYWSKKAFAVYKNDRLVPWNGEQ